jgi:hypothetical protein
MGHFKINKPTAVIVPEDLSLSLKFPEGSNGL